MTIEEQIKLKDEIEELESRLAWFLEHYAKIEKERESALEENSRLKSLLYDA
jgi:hypothetical protein